ncbi:hypothetical protein EW026_g3053 [Hermanssonia centrifuga]|uniref:Uncharacterized protein n=1 Tax=Hermanssonia centrifuga TaxID=98765 RepID=A0A4S4KMF8_9APHY|nr:hypothetical protein EW026_g3053 [Hermanssonia centrifuga]
MSRPGTASGYPQQMQAQPQGHPQHSQQSQQSPTQGQPQTVQMQHQAHTPTTLTPTSATYPPIAPIPVPGSPTRGAKRKAGTPGPSSTGTPAPPQQGQSHMQGQVPPQQHGQTQTQQLSQAQMLAQMQGRMPSGMGGGPGMNMTGNASAASGMTPAQLASMRMSAGMNNANMMAGLMGGAGGGMMGPPVLPRSQSLPQVDMSLPGMNGINGMGMNGMPVQSISRQASSGDLRDIASAATSPTAANVAGLSINAGLNQAMAMGTGPGGINSMSVPSASSMMMSLSSSPNPAMLGAALQCLANMGMATEKKISGQGLLVNAAPLGRMSSDVSSNAAGPSAMAPSSGDTAVAAASTAAPSVSSAPTVIPQLPPLPANVSLNPKTTRVSVVPLIDSENLIPQLAPDEIANVQKWMQVDKEYEGMYKKMRDRMTEEVRDVVVKTRPWWEKDPLADARGNRRRRDKFEIIGMKGGKDERSRRKLGKREGFKLPRTVDPEGASRPEQLVPIRLEFDVEHHKMRDTFLWNLNDPIITPEIFAQSVVDDYSLAPSYHAVITKTIQDQLSDFKSHSTFFGEDGIPNSPVEDVSVKGSFDDEDAVWWDAWRQNAQKDVSYKKVSGREEAHSRKRRKIVKDEVVDHAEIPPAVEKDQPMSVDDFEEDDSKALEEMRILIKLDIIVGPLKLEDQFEWDLDSLDPSPERFAEVYAKELGLGGEFRTSIAHSIREQAQIYQKSLFLVGHPSDGTMLQDDDLRMSLLPSLHTGARSMDQVGAFTPILSYLSDSEIERNEKEREKELNRRRRKTTRGRRGVALPDREPPKTFRTPAIGFPEVDAATLAAVNAAAAPTSRRAAAAAASLTIANMVASENGTAPITQNIPIPAAPSAPVVLKEKKPKGLFKAPSYSPTVLRPRAHVVAPIASTAADPSTVPPPSENDMPVSTGAPESRGARVVFSAKRVKELEREAKEREQEEQARIAASRKKRPQANNAIEASSSKAPTVEPETPMKPKSEVWVEIPSFIPGPPEPSTASGDVERAASPISTASSISEAPLAQAVKTNGIGHSAQSAPASTTVDSPPASTEAPATPNPGPPPTPASAPPPARPPPRFKRGTMPPWLSQAMAEMQERYPDDRFEAILRVTTGVAVWRIKCLDCPGKLYTPGPGETLTNYEVHIGNRLHRLKVTNRLEGDAQP